ncbi:MAG: head fiber protein [Bifidobacteriaceae bacterium]|jgi:hypothetical protein|nr:head fiber protein [Bifidobacteriaceae bacterium]
MGTDSSVIVTSRSGIDQAALLDPTLDLAYGSDENDFELSFLDQLPADGDFGQGSKFYVENTEYGGIVDSVESAVKGGVTTITYFGRTWSGMLSNKIVSPDANTDYLIVSGDLKTILTTIVKRLSLDALFIVDTLTSNPTVKFQFDRYVTAWDGIRKMLTSSNLKLTLKYLKGKVHVNVAPTQDWTDEVDSDLLDFTAKRDYRIVNHLIGLGQGELRARAISHWYADAAGKVSQKQSLFGVDEVCATYDYSNAGADELATETQKKLTELQSQGSIDVTLHDGHVFDLGDTVSARDNTTGLKVSATVTKKIVKIDGGFLSVSYEVGNETSSSTSLSGTAEATVGGHVYYAGAGITLADYTFSAEVSKSDLTAIQTTVTTANKTVSDMSATVGSLSDTATAHGTAITKAQSTADAATKTAGSAVQTVTGTAPLAATRTNNDVTLSVSTASGTTAGLMSASDKTKLDGIEAKANAYTLPTATPESLGGVKPDGKTITIDATGTITAHGESEAAGFLAAWPIGSIYETTQSTNPGDAYGGTWTQLPSLGGFLWKRTA